MMETILNEIFSLKEKLHISGSRFLNIKIGNNYTYS